MTMTGRLGLGKGYTKLLAILLCIAIIPCLLLSAIAYYISGENAKKQAVTYSMQYLNLIVESNTAMVKQAKGIIYEMMFNFDNYSDVLRNRPNSVDAFNLQLALEKKKVASEAALKSFYFVDNRSRKLYASDRSSIYDFEDVPDQNLVKLLNEPNDTLILNDLFSRKTSSGETVASYVVHYPLTGEPLGYLVVDLDLKQLVPSPENPKAAGGHLLITNKHGDLVNPDQGPWLEGITSSPGDYVVIPSRSADTGLSYQYVISKSLLTANNRILLVSIVIICAILVLLETIAAWFSSRRLYTPLRNLLHYIRQLSGDSGTRQEEESGDEYHYLRRVITAMNLQNKDYTNTMQANGVLFKQRQLSRLLVGEPGAYLGMVVPDKMRLRLPHPHFTVMVLEAGDRADYLLKYTGLEKELMLYSVTNIVEEVLKGYGEAVSTPLDSYRVAVLINHEPQADEGVFEEMARGMQEQVMHFLKITLTVGIGTVETSRDAIPSSYEQAQRALAHKVYYGKGSILSAVKLPEGPAVPKKQISWNEMREQLKVLLQNGAWEPVREFIAALSRQSAYAGMTEVDLQIVYLQYSACLSDLCADFSVPFEELHENDEALEQNSRQIASLGELNGGMLAVTAKLHERIKSMKDHIHQELIQNILLYIRDHLDQDLTLETIAEKVYMHPAYLSRICKSLTGKSLGEQIVQARIDRAKELLSGSNKSVGDISSHIGYTNPRAFYRLFKDYTGLTPGEFRKNEGLKNVK